MKIMEWNINHRLGISNVDMPTWVAKEIKEKQKADITIITECCNRIPNWKNDFLDAFDKHTYLTFSSNNDQVGNNDVTILINKENINVISAYSFLAEGHSAPDHLQLNCRTKDTNKEFTIVGLRIHTMNISDIEKRKQFCLVLDNLSKKNSVIIAGDFNCNRRSFTDIDKWNINAIDDIIRGSYTRITPDGASWARDVLSEDNYCFALDHFLVKGVRHFKVHPYDRSFVSNEPSIYKWGTDFQAKYGWENKNNNVINPYPDHAILSADFSI